MHAHEKQNRTKTEAKQCTRYRRPSSCESLELSRVWSLISLVNPGIFRGWTLVSGV